jgi:hypothetical protein
MTVLNAFQTALRPGERIVANALDVFDLKAFNAWRSDVECATAPLDLSHLTDDELRGLRMSWLNRDMRLPRDALTIAVGYRIGWEFERRHMDSAGRRSALAQGLAA